MGLFSIFLWARSAGRWLEFPPLQPSPRTPMGKAPARSDQGEAFDIAVDLPDPFGGAHGAARDRRAPDAVARKVLVETVCGMAALEDREPQAEIVVALVLHHDRTGDLAVDHRGQRRDRGV